MPEEVLLVAEMTIGQRDNARWMDTWQWRITSSNLVELQIGRQKTIHHCLNCYLATIGMLPHMLSGGGWPWGHSNLLKQLSVWRFNPVVLTSASFNPISRCQAWPGLFTWKWAFSVLETVTDWPQNALPDPLARDLSLIMSVIYNFCELVRWVRTLLCIAWFSSGLLP